MGLARAKRRAQPRNKLIRIVLFIDNKSTACRRKEGVLGSRKSVVGYHTKRR